MKRSVASTLLALSALTLCYFLKSRKREASKDDDEIEPAVPSSTNSNSTNRGVLGLADHQLPPHLLRERIKEKRRKSMAALLSMKSPLYDNINMNDPQGQLICKISSSKAKWYISKELADWVEGGDGNNDCIQLRFQPKVPSNRSTEVYLKSDKENACVSCGATKNIFRHHIVPFAYRSLLPEKYKSHMSHDIVILCSYCRLDCEKQTRLRIKEFEEKSAPPEGYEPKYHNDQELYKVRSAALALKN